MSEQHAKVVTLRVSVKADDPRTMEEFIQDLKDGIQADSPTDPMITVFTSDYLVDGHNVSLERYNRGERTPVETRNPFPTGRAREARRLASDGMGGRARPVPPRQQKPSTQANVDDAMAKALQRLEQAGNDD